MSTLAELDRTVDLDILVWGGGGGGGCTVADLETRKNPNTSRGAGGMPPGNLIHALRQLLV